MPPSARGYVTESSEGKPSEERHNTQYTIHNTQYTKHKTQTQTQTQKRNKNEKEKKTNPIDVVPAAFSLTSASSLL
jgi:hypothetical protein